MRKNRRAVRGLNIFYSAVYWLLLSGIRWSYTLSICALVKISVLWYLCNTPSTAYCQPRTYCMQKVDTLKWHFVHDSIRILRKTKDNSGSNYIVFRDADFSLWCGLYWDNCLDGDTDNADAIGVASFSALVAAKNICNVFSVFNVLVAYWQIMRWRGKRLLFHRWYWRVVQ